MASSMTLQSGHKLDLIGKAPQVYLLSKGVKWRKKD